jgi:hypothetical protein
VENEDDKSGSCRDLESCVVAGACTVPMRTISACMLFFLTFSVRTGLLTIYLVLP